MPTPLAGYTLLLPVVSKIAKGLDAEKMQSALLVHTKNIISLSAAAFRKNAACNVGPNPR
jgi:hypothetical protein